MAKKNYRITQKWKKRCLYPQPPGNKLETLKEKKKKTFITRVMGDNNSKFESNFFEVVSKNKVKKNQLHETKRGKTNHFRFE